MLKRLVPEMGAVLVRVWNFIIIFSRIAAIEILQNALFPPSPMPEILASQGMIHGAKPGV
jgi:hypothetical protein